MFVCFKFFGLLAQSFFKSFFQFQKYFVHHTFQKCFCNYFSEIFCTIISQKFAENNMLFPCTFHGIIHFFTPNCISYMLINVICEISYDFFFDHFIFCQILVVMLKFKFWMLSILGVLKCVKTRTKSLITNSLLPKLKSQSKINVWDLDIKA